MKKIAVYFGGAITAFAPIALVVACGAQSSGYTIPDKPAYDVHSLSTIASYKTFLKVALIHR